MISHYAQKYQQYLVLKRIAFITLAVKGKKYIFLESGGGRGCGEKNTNFNPISIRSVSFLTFVLLQATIGNKSPH